MKHIVFITKGVHAASSRYRALNYFPYFKEQGWRPAHLPDNRKMVGRIKILMECRKADAVVLVRRTLSWWLLKAIRLLSKQLIFDFDDAIFQKSDGSPSQTRARRFSTILKHADQVWTGNSYLANIARQHNPMVTVLPTSIAASKYTVAVTKEQHYLDLVWIGSSSTRKHLESIFSALEQSAQQIPNLRLKIIADFSLPSSQIDVIEIPWSPESEVSELLSAHIGIAPLPDNEFTRGKCGLKVLQYMACGLPVISSPTGVNKELVLHGISGLLAQTPEEWIDAINDLATLPDLRESMGQAGKELFNNSFTLETTFQKMTATLK